MRETISTAMPPCFDRWCKRFDNIFKTKAQKKEFRHYLGGLLGESERKNLSQMAEDTVDVSYHSLRHFLVRASWGEQEINGVAKRVPSAAPFRGDEKLPSN